MRVDVVIPAWNEATTIGPIIETLQATKGIGKVIVVIDIKTTDNTPGVAMGHHAHVIKGDTLAGKGQCVTAGLMRVDTSRVLFCDADITGLTTKHVSELIQPFKGNPMVVGVPDFPGMDTIPAPFKNSQFVNAWPWISGQRCMATWIALGTTLTGYRMERQLTRANERAGRKIIFKQLEGVKSPLKLTDPTRLATMLTEG